MVRASVVEALAILHVTARRLPNARREAKLRRAAAKGAKGEKVAKLAPEVHRRMSPPLVREVQQTPRSRSMLGDVPTSQRSRHGEESSREEVAVTGRTRHRLQFY